MFWIILAIIVIVVVVYNNNKKKKQQGQGGQTPPQQRPPQPTRTASPKQGTSAGTSKTGAPPKAGDPIDQAAFARAFAHMSGDDSKAAPKAAAKPEAPKAEAPKPEPSKPAEDAAFQKFAQNILGYYHGLWNRDNGSLYTELDTMPIHHFSVQVKEDRLIESVWLEGDEIPLVTDTNYDKICGGDPVYPMSTQALQDKLLGLIYDYLQHLGTVEVRGQDCFPVRAGQSQPAPAEPQAPQGKIEQQFSQSEKEEQFRARVQALMEQQRKDNPPKK